ncbi:uncharacterized protein PHALS_04553 [Plasmopara halstedii]|uniref:Uncharacterized protein n=1 Tax=Plasmopara halstedii TaxID=4781 RepID=A0A0P1AAD0_PLAHL|nr:uncharacterized protein PHALS_04553 [Plasmopara halstedii]CEG37094.1 hypothetical protein PHALS_04553 [Plasmopara halstedii]|eukprot:XP_024573463.1 hypothetical protein PHALS_04553 [Plasmopara halstedii]
MKWWISLSTDEMYKKLGLFPIEDHGIFVLQVGQLIWEKINRLGEEVFNTFMLTKMLERSKDEIKWARIIYDLQNEYEMGFSLVNLFDGLIWAKDKGAEGCRPSEAVKFLTDVKFTSMLATKNSREEIVKKVLIKLRERSKDELMWAKLVYMLRFHEKVPDVFDAVIRPQCVKHIIRSLRARFITSGYLWGLMMNWAKLLYILRNDDEVSKIAPDLLDLILSLWTKNPYGSVQYSPHASDWREETLTNIKFTVLSEYADFSSDNPNTFMLKTLLKLSPEEVEWALVLNKLQKSNDVQNPLSGVLGALLHSWIATPQHAAAKNDHILIDAFRFLLKTIRPRSAIRDTAQKMAHELLLKSKNAYMWAAFLYKLQEDETLTKTASPVFDILVQIHKPNGAKIDEIKSTVNTLKKTDLTEAKRYTDSLIHPVLELIPDWRSDLVTWAKVLYLLQNIESVELQPLFSYLLETLVYKWATEFGIKDNEMFLSSDHFDELKVYAQFSNDDPNVLLLNSLRGHLHDDLTLARRLNEDRKKKSFLIGALSALLCSWIGMPFDVNTHIETMTILVRVYEYLSHPMRIVDYNKNQNFGETTLDAILDESADKVMWAKFLNKLQNDAFLHDLIFEVSKDLVSRME